MIVVCRVIIYSFKRASIIMSILAGCDTSGVCVCVPCEYIVIMQGMIQRKNILVF